MEEFLGIVLRVSIMYLYAMFLLRLSGKRSIGDLTPLDFLVALLIGDQFDDVFWGDLPLANGLVGMGTLFFMHLLISVVSFHSRWFDEVVLGSKPELVIKQGKIIHQGLARERTPETELWSELRLKQEDQLQEVKEANWEPNGRVSVIKQEQAKPVQKQDLDRFLEIFK